MTAKERDVLRSLMEICNTLGSTYYTWEEAMAAVEQLGNGWRKPTDAEWEALCNLGSTWDDERKGRWFGDNLLFPAAGYLKCADRCLVHVGTAGYYWSSLLRGISSLYAADMDFDSTGAYPAGRITRSTHGFPVRCVRNVK